MSPVGMRAVMSPLFVRALNANGWSSKVATMSPASVLAENSCTCSAPPRTSPLPVAMVTTRSRSPSTVTSAESVATSTGSLGGTATVTTTPQPGDSQVMQLPTTSISSPRRRSS